MPFTFVGRRDAYLATGARAVSSCGDFLAATALVLALQQRGAGGFAVAAILIAAAVPPVLLVRWTGRLVDRADSRFLLVVTPLVQAGVCVALAYASGPAEIIALLAVLAAGLAVTGPTLSALLPLLADAEDLPRVMALGQTANSVALLLAPVLGGVLVGQFGLRIPLLADAASYVALAAAGRLIRTRRGGQRRTPGRAAPRQAAAEEAAAPGQAAPRQAATPGQAAAKQAAAPGQAAPGQAAPGQAAPPPRADGWQLRQDPLLWPAVVLVGAVLTAVSLVNVAEVFFIRETLHASAGAYGLLAGLWTAAAMTGGWLLGRRRPSDAALGAILLAALAMACLGVAAMAAAPAVGWLVPANVVGGLGNGGVNVAAGVLLGRRAPSAARGRAFAVYSAVANAASTLGFVLGGVLLGLIPARACIAAAGLAGLAVTAALALPVLRAAARERDPRGLTSARRQETAHQETSA